MRRFTRENKTFQFHTGSIKGGRAGVDGQACGFNRFNSTLVRLKVASPPVQRIVMDFVSIPHWFD